MPLLQFQKFCPRCKIYSCALKFAVRFACAAGGPARTAPEGLIPLDSLSPLRRELEWQSSLLHLALPAKRMAGRVGEYGKSFHSRV